MQRSLECVGVSVVPFLIAFQINLITKMGQASGSAKEEPAPTLEVVNDNIQLLFGEHWEAGKVELVNDPIIVISRNLSEGGSFEQKEEGFQVNPVLLKCVYHPAFEKTIKSLMGLLIR